MKSIITISIELYLTLFHCSHKFLPIEKNEEPQFRRRISSSSDQRAVCSRHSGEMLKMYCFDCKKRVCRDCTTSDHKGHKCGFMNSHDVAKQEIMSTLAPVKEFSGNVVEAIGDIQWSKEAVSTQGQSVEQMICDSFEKLKVILEQRKQVLLKQSREIVNEKMNILQEQEKEMKEAQGEMSELISYVDKTAAKTSAEQFAAMKNDLCKQMLELMHKNRKLYLRPKEVANTAIHTVPAEMLAQLCQETSEVYEFQPDPSRCILRGSGLEAATTNQEARFTLDLVDVQGHVCQTKQAVRAELKSEAGENSTTIKATLVSHNSPTYEMAYVPIQRGRHVLSVHVNNVDIATFKVFVQYPPTQLDKPTTMITGVLPNRVSLSPEGLLYISESQHCRISVFSRDGNKVRSIGLIGSPPFGYARTTGTAVHTNGDLYVSTFASKVYRLSKKGEVISTVGKEGTGNGEFKWADGIKIFNDQLYVCDYGNSRINVFDLNLKFIRTFGKSTDGPGQLQSPADIAIDTQGNAYVADYSLHRVVVFSPDGAYLTHFGGEGEEKGRLKSPVGICTTPHYVYVSEQGNNRISIFHTTGQFVGTLCKEGSGAGELNYPWGLAVDQDGFLFICDSKNNRIQIF